MPLPKPNTGEKQDEYVSRCVSYVFDEGTLQGRKLDPESEDDRKQAVAVCNAAWRDAQETAAQEVVSNMDRNIDYFISLAEQAVETATAAISGGTRTMKELAEKNGKTVAEIADKLLADIWTELSEAKMMKTVGGEKYPASDFLVVEDSEKPSTWHLQVKKNGTPDHALMGAAKAALTSPGGHRGNKYEGPEKDAATSKLKALYKAEDMPWAGEEKKKEQATEADTSALRDLLQKALDMLPADSADGEPDEEPDEEPEEEAPEEEAAATEFEEIDINETGGTAGVSITGHALSISEVGDVATGGTKPLKLEIVPIRPGWGNTRDNNYYSEDALRNGAALFNKVKMFETNHIEAETNNRNWVSTIIETPRFTESSEPVSVVGVHDPSFAQKVLNLNELDLLGMLECSIRGHGRVRQGDFELGGRKGKYVEELTDISSVDWVSKAGAGGRALGLAENEDGGGNMSKDEKELEQEPTETPAEETTEEVALGEEEAPNEEPQALTEAQIAEALDGVALPEHTKALLSARAYADAEELDATVKQVVAEFKQAAGSGKPIATRGKQAAEALRPNRAAIEKAQDAVNQRYLSTRVRESKEE
jgi:hypothetical protein